MPVVVGGTQAVPGCQDFATLKDRVARYVRAPDDAEVRTSIGYEINDAIRELNTRNWLWAITSSDITLTASTADYTIPTDFRAPRILERLNTLSQRDGRIPWIEPKTFMDRTPSSTVDGSPSLYTVRNFTNSQQLTLDVAPDSGFVGQWPTLRLRYYRRLPTLTNDSDCLDCPSEVELFIVWAARYAAALQMDTTAYRIQPALAEKKAIWARLTASDTESEVGDWGA